MARRRKDVTVETLTGHVDLQPAPFQIRLRGDLKRALEEAAIRARRSINAEIIARLENSFTQERTVGGHGMRWLVTLVVSAFTVAGQMRAPSNPDPLKNRQVYRAGMFAVIDAMMAALPDATAEEIALEIEGLRGRLLSRVARERMEEGA
jgi:hypothetical protein